MKKFVTLRNVIMGAAAFVALLFFFLSFAVNASGIADLGEGNMRITFKGVIWGSHTMVGTNLATGASNAVSIKEMLGVSSTGLNLPVFFGILLPLLAAIAVGVCLFVVKNKKVFTYVVLGAALLFVAGGILQFFSVSGLRGAIADRLVAELNYPRGIAINTAELFTSAYNLKVSALSVISGVFTILAGCGLVVSQVVEDKPLMK